MIIGLIQGELARRAATMVVPYAVQARWRAGPIGRPIPVPRRRSMPAPNPAVNVARAPERRVMRAAALSAAARGVRVGATRGRRR